MPHPEHAVDPLTGSADGLRLFESLAAAQGRRRGVTPLAGAGGADGVRRRRSSSASDARDDAAAADARRPSRARDPGRDPLRPRAARARSASARTPSELVDAIVAARTWADFGLEPDELSSASAAERADAADVLRAFYGLCAERPREAALGRQDARLREADASRSATLLEEARFVHLIRDGRDVALSRRARGMGADKPIADDRRPLAPADRGRPQAGASACAAATWSSATRTWSPIRSPPCAASASWSSSTTTRRCSPTTSAPASGSPSSATWPPARPARPRPGAERAAAHALTTASRRAAPGRAPGGPR